MAINEFEKLLHFFAVVVRDRKHFSNHYLFSEKLSIELKLHMKIENMKCGRWNGRYLIFIHTLGE